LFWDVGGVVLSDGWDSDSRLKATEKYGLDREDFEERHQEVVAAFETGKMDLDEYMERTVFYRVRAFTKEDFTDFVLAQSQPYPATLDILKRFAESKTYLLATLNNESLDLNRYRIERFGLRDYFSVFFSSCFLGIQKPQEAIYRMALQMTQRAPQASVFIDDRTENLEPARRCGMRTVHYQNPGQLQRELVDLGIEI